MTELIEIITNSLFLLNIFFVLIIVFIEQKRPTYTLFWTVFVLLVPYVGFIFYLFFGLGFRKKRLAKKFYNIRFLKSTNVIKHSNQKGLDQWRRLISYLEMVSQNSLTSDNQVKIFSETKDFFDDLKSNLTKAKSIINMEYYIFRYDEIGREICEILIKKATQGLKINLIIDGAGKPSRRMIRKLRKNKINVKIFFPSHIPFIKIGNLRANYRNHKKVTVIDSQIAYTGGINIGDDYLGKSKIGRWRDLALKLTGEVVYEIEQEFYHSLNLVSKNLNTPPIPIEQKTTLKKIDSRLKIFSKTYLQVIGSGPNYEYKNLRNNYLKLIQTAKKSISIETPYFVPDDTLLDALKIAALSGVNIKLIIPHKPDHHFVYWVNQYFVGELIGLGAKIYQYKKGFLHSKLVIIDDEVACLGSGNFDNRSFYQNFEMNINIYQRKIVKDLIKIFNTDISDSQMILHKTYNERALTKRIKESIFKLLAPIL